MNQSEPTLFTLKDELHIDVIGIKKAALLIRAVHHPVRQSLLRAISQAGETTVTALRLPFNMQQPIASSHLAVLRKAGVVATRREGKKILYSLRHDRLARLRQSIEKFMG